MEDPAPREHCFGSTTPTVDFDTDQGSRAYGSAPGTTRTFGHVRFCAAIGERADIERARSDILVYESAVQSAVQSCCPAGKSPISLSIPSCKNIPLRRRPKSNLYPSMSRPERGAFRDRHKRWAGMRWTQAARRTSDAAGGRRSRVVLTPRRWCQVGGINFRR